VNDSREHLGPDHWRTADAELALGECLLAMRQYSRAEPLLRQAAAVIGRNRRRQPLLAREADAILRRLERARGKAPTLDR